MNKISLMVNAMMLSLIIFAMSCASWGQVSAPTLANRTLEISKDIPGFVYWSRVCDHTILGICVRTKIQKETYDLTDPLVRQKLIDMGFVAHVEQKKIN